jgi:hypothetical protein
MVPEPQDGRAELEVGEFIEAIAVEQRRLRQILEGRVAGSLTVRPAGKWSILEHVRHLVFAEQAHLGGFYVGGQEWSPFGHTPATMLQSKQLVDSGNAGPALEEVLLAWEATHANAATELANLGGASVRKALRTNLRHLRSHVAVVERLARRS